MFKKVTATILSLSLLTALPQVHAAKSVPAQAAQNVSQGPRKHLATIVFAGLAGAILGLSTLSFYGRPQDRLSNIAVGFAFGVISGTLYTTYKAAAEPKDFYSLRQATPEVWRLSEDREHARQQNQPKASFTFQF